jgi:hypothetical protein
VPVVGKENNGKILTAGPTHGSFSWQNVNSLFVSETTESIKIKLGASDESSDGYLTKEDWNAFNEKQNEFSSI